MALHVDRQNLSVVVLGAFNPAIFHPSWFHQSGLLGEHETDAAEIEISHPEVSVFRTSWCRLEVTRERFSVQTDQESHYPNLRDLAAGTLEVLGHTPVRVLGVNHGAFLRLPDEKTFNALGWKLVPKDHWEGVLEQPGVASLVEQGVRPDEFDGYVRVKLEPVLDRSMRILVEVNDHFVLTANPGPLGGVSASSTRLGDVLFGHWDDIEQRAAAVVKRVEEWVK